MSWVLVENPGFAGKKPRILEAVCHDGTPFLTMQCSFCQEQNHIHESQIEGFQESFELAMRCHRCRIENVTTVAFVREAFSEMREQGWIK